MLKKQKKPRIVEKSTILGFLKPMYEAKLLTRVELNDECFVNFCW